MVRSWKVPAALWLAGLVLKIVLSILVNDLVGSIVAGILGFAALVTLLLWADQRSRARRARRGGPAA